MEETQKKILFEIMIGSATEENIKYFQDLIKGFEIPIADLEEYCNNNCIFNDMKMCHLNGLCKLVEYIEIIKGREERYNLLRKCFNMSDNTIHYETTTTASSTADYMFLDNSYYIEGSQTNTTKSEEGFNA